MASREAEQPCSALCSAQVHPLTSSCRGAPPIPSPTSHAPSPYSPPAPPCPPCLHGLHLIPPQPPLTSSYTSRGIFACLLSSSSFQSFLLVSCSSAQMHLQLPPLTFSSQIHPNVRASASLSLCGFPARNSFLEHPLHIIVPPTSIKDIQEFLA